LTVVTRGKGSVELYFKNIKIVKKGVIETILFKNKVNLRYVLNPWVTMIDTGAPAL
jgi:hypothetical protein